MDEQTADKFISATHWPRTMATAALGFGALFLAVLAMSALKEYRYIGAGISASNTISVSGEGEVFAVPDTATFSVTVQEEAKEVADAQEAASMKSNDIKKYLMDSGIDEKDIKTTDYSIYPQYDYVQSELCRSEGYCPSNQVLRGYQTSETISVKVRDTEKAGELLAGVGSRGATNVSGISFTIDDEDALQAEARGKAIDDARAKAAELAKQLKVSLVRVVGFYENDYGYPVPMAYGMGGDAVMTKAESARIAPDISVGENKITSNVSITYEIR
jgi:hypothetical protein